MEGKSSSKNKARLIVMIVFIIGFAAGALSLNLYQRLTSTNDEANRNNSGPELTGNEYIVNKMSQRLGLSPEQQEQIKAILEERNSRFRAIRTEMEPLMKEFEPRFSAIRQESRDKIRAVLKEDQRPKYEELLQEADQSRQREKDKHKGRR